MVFLRKLEALTRTSTWCSSGLPSSITFKTFFLYKKGDEQQLRASLTVATVSSSSTRRQFRGPAPNVLWSSFGPSVLQKGYYGKESWGFELMRLSSELQKLLCCIGQQSIFSFSTATSSAMV